MSDGRKKKHVVIAGAWVDASIDEVHVAASEITSHPVEEGIEVSDNILPTPDFIRITGIITNHPIELPESHTDGASVVDLPFTYDKGAPQVVQAVAGGGLLGAVAGAITGALGLNEGGGVAKGFDPPMQRVANVYTEWLRVKNERELFEISTTLRDYKNMAMESLEVARNVEDGNNLNFIMVAREVIVVTSDVTEAADPQVNIADQKVSKGKTPKTDVDAALGELGSSVFNNVTGG